MFEASLCVVGLGAASAEEVIRALAGRLHAAGRVRDSFADAAVLRERRSPTGLPFEEGAVGLPHADAEHVIAPGIAIASLSAAVSFRQMGAPAIELATRLVVMPALASKQQAAGGLARLLEILKDPAVREALVRAKTCDEMFAALGQLP